MMMTTIRMVIANFQDGEDNNHVHIDDYCAESWHSDIMMIIMINDIADDRRSDDDD